MVQDSQGRVVEFGSCGPEGWTAWQPRDPDHVRHEIPHEAHFTLDHGGGARRHRADPPSDDGSHLAVCHCGKSAIYKKKPAKITITGDTVREQNGRIIAEVGTTLTVTHDAPIPIKLWVNQRPVAGPMTGKMKTMDIVADATGEFTFDLHCPKYHAEKLVILVMPKEEEP